MHHLSLSPGDFFFQVFEEHGFRTFKIFGIFVKLTSILPASRLLIPASPD